MKKALFYIAFLALGFIIAWAMNILERTVANRLVLLGIGIIFGIGGGLFTFMQLRERGKEMYLQILGALAGLFVAFFLSASLAVIANSLTAHAFGMKQEKMRVCRLVHQTKYRTRRVGRRGVPHGKVPYQVYAVYVIDNQGDTLRTKITKDEYRRLHRDDTIDVLSARGLMGWRVTELAD